MKIGLNSRFCDNCRKNVVDFTQMDKEEIVDYLLHRQSENVCGRISRSQLDFSNTDLFVTIKTLSEKNKNSNLSFYLLTVGALVLAGCNQSAGPQEKEGVATSLHLLDTMDGSVANYSDSKVSDSVSNSNEKYLAEFLDDILLGEIEFIPDSVESGMELYRLVEVMPEFKGGIDSLERFIQRNLSYPEWERKQKIEGLVYVSFIVDKNGQVRNPEILRTVPGSRNFEREVFRLLNHMPEWIPGQQAGMPVDVQINLPIKFKL
jgi:TonB family protein